MKITLPRPDRRHIFGFHEAGLIYCIADMLPEDGILDCGKMTPSAFFAAKFGTDEETITRALASLVRYRHMLLGSKAVAISCHLSPALSKERKMNQMRKSRSGDGTPPDWTLHHRVRQLFPCLRARMDRPASYTVPAAFAPLLAGHEHHHRKECPPDVEILTEACYPGELTSVLTMIEEQLSANRKPVLLYTRKAIYLGIRRAPKR